MITSIRIDRRYNGPPDSANGGYACGVFAQHARLVLETGEADVVVQLYTPPPLATDLRMEAQGRRAHVWYKETLVASVTPGPPSDRPLTMVSLTEAEYASRHFLGRTGHPFPTCYVCGPNHRDTGLRLAPGPVDNRPDLVACIWTPEASHTGADGRVRAELIWAVLDCPGGWTLDMVRAPLVLSRLSVRIRTLPSSGDTTIIVGCGAPGKGRTASCHTGLFRPDGTELARALATWVRLSPSTTTSNNGRGDLQC